MIMQLIAAFGETLVSGFSLGGGSKLHIALDPADGNVIWYVTGNTAGSSGQTKGYVQKDGYDSGDAITLANHEAWTTPLAGWGTMYVRLSDTGAVSPTASSHAVDGSTWHTMTEDTTQIWWRTTATGAIVQVSTVLVELATDSGGTNIVASGSYTSTVSSES